MNDDTCTTCDGLGWLTDDVGDLKKCPDCGVIERKLAPAQTTQPRPRTVDAPELPLGAAKRVRILWDGARIAGTEAI